jgi:erythromycin esterase
MQLQPLVAYVAEVARGPRPLILAGIDVSGHTVLADTMIAELRLFLEANQLAGPFADPESPATQMLKRLHSGAYRPTPDSLALTGFARAIAATADRIESVVNTHEGQYWARILRNAALRAAWRWPQWPDRRPYCATTACQNTHDRDPEMAENLSWLANQLYPGRRIIVWAHNVHIMRNPSLTQIAQAYGAEWFMGDRVSAEFGDASYAIAPVSYEGSYRWAPLISVATYNIIPDQHPDAEFEELMAALGHPFALVDLRNAAPGDGWLAQPFLARPIVHRADRAAWTQVYDAFLFIRSQEPSAPRPR